MSFTGSSCVGDILTVLVECVCGIKVCEDEYQEAGEPRLNAGGSTSYVRRSFGNAMPLTVGTYAYMRAIFPATCVSCRCRDGGAGWTRDATAGQTVPTSENP